MTDKTRMLLLFVTACLVTALLVFLVLPEMLERLHSSEIGGKLARYWAEHRPVFDVIGYIATTFGVGVPGVFWLVQFIWPAANRSGAEASLDAGFSRASEQTPRLRAAAKREHLARLREGHLRDIARQNDDELWHPGDFTPLNAEVEVTGPKAEEGKLANLVDAVEEYRERQELLIIGEPGSGKSVGLRHLALKLLGLPGKGRIPLYVNLREWEAGAHDSLIDSLKHYIKDVAKRRLEAESREFLDAHFDELLDQGCFLLLLDSFDEIPGVLGGGSPDRFKTLCGAIHDLFSQSRKRRGILASRPLLGSALELGNKAVTLTIRPFDEEAVKHTLQWHKQGSYSVFDDELLLQLFRPQSNLAGIANNPFYAWLLRFFAEHHHRLPSNQLELFNAYFDEQLKVTRSARRGKGLDDQRTFAACIAIADELFDAARNSEYPPLVALAARLPDLAVTAVVDVLGPPRLFRSMLASRQVHDNPDARIGFIHRRFQEFLLAKSVLTGRRLLDIDAVIDDAAWSDVLILYCQVCDRDTARRIASQCWAQVRLIQGERINLRKPAHARAVRNLQFMTQAFAIGSNTAALAPFRQQMDELLESAFRPSDPESGDAERKSRVHRYTAGFALDATALASPDTVASMLHKALQTGDPRLSEKAFRSCRNLSMLSLPLERSLRAYIDAMPWRVFVRQRSNLLFALSLADAFRPVRLYVQTKWAQLLTWLGLFGVLLLASLLSGVVSILYPAFALPMSAELKQTLTPVLVVVWIVGLLISIWHERFWELRDWVAEGPGTAKNALLGFLSLLGLAVAGLLGLAALYGLVWLALATGHWISGLPQVAPDAEVVGLWMGVLVGLGGALIAGSFALASQRRRAQAMPKDRAGWVETLRTDADEIRRGARSLKHNIEHGWPIGTLHDARQWRRVKSLEPKTLEVVEECFRSFRTPEARLRYVERKLEPLMKPPDGSWRDAVPDLGDEASTRLWGLAEKWKA